MLSDRHRFIAALALCGCLSGFPVVLASDASAAITAPRYRLGPGDRLMVKLFQVQGFDATVAVLPDGTLNLPRIASLQVSGMTLDQARKAITQAYGLVLRRPVVYVDLVSTRPLRVTITGEVQRPGLYSIGVGDINQLANSDGGEATKIASQGWPTLVEAIQKAGGLTTQGDLRRVTLIRRPAGNLGRNQTIEVNYWEALRTGEPIENPLIYDGDSIRIPLAEQQKESELIAISSSVFAPASITVNVEGEVKRPGPQRVKANSTLSNALLSAGGLSLKGNRNTIELLRLQRNGTVDRKIYPYQPGAAMGDAANPPLRDGDVVVVDRHLWSKFNDGLKAVVEPLGPVLNAASIFRLFAL